MKANAIIIQRPGRQPAGRRALFTVMTLMAWLVWISLWLPLITLVAWGFGLHTGYVQLFAHNPANGWAELGQLVFMALCCSLLVSVWSSYNWWRFRFHARRRERRVVPLDAIAERLGVPPLTAQALQDNDRVVVRFADHRPVGHDPIVPATGQPAR